MIKENLKKIGGKVKEARRIMGDTEGHKVTQSAFAEMLGISRSYLGDIETGRIEPSLSILSRTAELSGLPLEFFQVGPRTHPATGIPILGTVRAGEPIDAVENILGYISVPVRGDYSDYFGLSVIGDSMELCCIREGDTVIVRKQPTVENGEIAVVIIDGDRATVKKFYRNGPYISLNPCSTNPEHQPRIIDPDVVPVVVLGKVIKAVISL